MQLNDKEIHKLFIESVRYSLTRHSYAPSECADLIRAKWGEIPNNTKVIIIRDINEAIEDDNRIDKQHKWPSDIRDNWVSLQNFIRLSESTKARSDIYFRHPVIMDDPTIETDEAAKLKHLSILNKTEPIRKSSGKHLRSMSEASEDVGSGIFIED
jgi:hypothetical protein